MEWGPDGIRVNAVLPWFTRTEMVQKILEERDFEQKLIGATPLMQAVQSMGIDLPLKALVWQDADGVTWVSYNDPAWLAHRHGLDDSTKATVNALTGALNAIATKATTPP